MHRASCDTRQHIAGRSDSCAGQGQDVARLDKGIQNTVIERWWCDLHGTAKCEWFGKECSLSVSKAAGDRAINAVSGETVSHNASVLSWLSHQQRSGLTVEAAMPMAPAQLASTHFPTHPSGLGICSRRGEFKFRSQHTGQAVRGLPPSKVCKEFLKGH